MEIAIQISGKIKARLVVAADATQEEVHNLALQEASVAQALEGKPVVKEIFVKGKLMNIVAK